MIRSLRLLILSLAVSLVCASGASAYGPLGGVNLHGGGPSADQFQLDYPSAIVRVPDGPDYSFYVADTGNNRIVKLDSDGNFVMAFGGSDGTSGAVSAPRSIAYGSDCDPGSGAAVPCLYVTEAYVVKRFSLGGQLLSSWGGSGSGNGQFNNAAGVAVDPTWGYVAVADRQNNRVQRFTPDGTWVETIGQGSGPSDPTVGHLLSPSGVGFDSNGRLWVVDTRNSYGYINHYARQGSAPFTYAYSDRLGDGVCSSCAGFMPGIRGIFADITAAGGNRVWATTSWDVASPNFRSHLFRIAGDSSSEPPFALSGPWGSSGTPASGPDDLYLPGQPFAAGDDLWVPESGNNRVHLYGSALSTPTSAGTWGESALADGFLRYTTRLAAAPDGSVFAWDAIKYRIQHFSANGEFVNAFGGYENDDPFIINQGIGGMAVRADGELLVSDLGHTVIKRFSPAGDYLGAIDLPEDECGSNDMYPGPLAVDATGRIYMFEYGNSCVIVMDGDGHPVAHFGQYGTSHLGGDLFQVQDIAVNPAGTQVFVLDNNRVKEFSSDDGTTWTGQPASSTSLGTGTALGEFSQPQGLDVDPTDGSVYVSDQRNNRVQRAVVGGDHSYAWSAFGSRGYGPEDFQMPQGLAIDGWGNMWVADLDSDSIKRYGDAPELNILSPIDGSSTTNDTATLTYEVSDPAAACSIASGSALALDLGSNTFAVTCTNAEGSDIESVTVDMYQAPQVTNLTASEVSPTVASSTALHWTTTGFPVPSCTVNGSPASSGVSVSLSKGSNTFAVVCSNPAGSDDESITVGRTVPSPADPSIKFPKKLKLSKTNKLTFNVTCPVGCKVSGKIKIGKGKSAAVKAAALAGQQAAQSARLSVSKSLAKKIRKALKSKKKVTLTVTVLAYGAKQGKSGSAILKK